MANVHGKLEVALPKDLPD